MAITFPNNPAIDRLPKWFKAMQSTEKSVNFALPVDEFLFFGVQIRGFRVRFRLLSDRFRSWLG
jgi:hypothetical protein